MAKVEHAVALPFSISATGSVSMTDNQSKIWADRVRSVLGTAIGERVSRYYFGSRIHLESWNNQEQATFGLDREVAVAFNNFLPTLSYTGLDATYDESTGVLNVVVKYTLPNNTAQTLKFGSVTIDGASIIKEM